MTRQVAIPNPAKENPAQDKNGVTRQVGIPNPAQDKNGGTRQVAIPTRLKDKNGGTRQVAIPNPALTRERVTLKRAASAGAGDRLTASAASLPKPATQKLSRPRQTRHTRQSHRRS
jgi:hypothetical protein